MGRVCFRPIRTSYHAGGSDVSPWPWPWPCGSSPWPWPWPWDPSPWPWPWPRLRRSHANVRGVAVFCDNCHLLGVYCLAFFVVNCH